MAYKDQIVEMNRLLGYTVESGASDLHIVIGRPPIVRIDSRLSEIEDYKVYGKDEAEKLLLSILDDGQKERLEQDRQIDFSYSYKDTARFRVNIYYQKDSLAGAFRHISSDIRTVTELNLPEKLLEFTELQQGLVLFVGPTGHGKSTSLAALIDKINQDRAAHIITIEDPVEYLFTQDKSIISQREVHQDAPGFAEAIRATLREDADVVMVGEMRDLESIATTITVAETGHLVFATLHTNDAAQTVDRIVDVFPSHQQNQIRSQLASILKGVVSQRLIPRIGGGRVPAVEIMIGNNAVQNVIREGRAYELDNIIHTGQADGMISIDKSLSQLVQNGLVKLEEAIGYSNNPEMFKSLIKRF